MEAIPIGILALLIGLGCGRALPNHRSARVALGLLLTACVIAIVFGLLMLTTDRFSRYFALETRFWGGVGIGYSLLFAGALAVGVLAVEARRQRRAFYGLAAGLFAIGVPTVYAKLFLGAAGLTNGARDAEGFSRQTTGFTCTAASVSNACHLFGQEISESQAAALMRLNFWGGSTPQIAHALSRLGYTFMEIDGQKIGAVNPPALIVVDWGVIENSHAILVVGQSGEGYEVVDPLSGKDVRPATWFDQKWRGLGLMAIRPLAPPAKVN